MVCGHSRDCSGCRGNRTWQDDGRLGSEAFHAVAAVMPAAIAVSYHLIPGPGYPENMELMAAFPALLALLTAAACRSPTGSGDLAPVFW